MIELKGDRRWAAWITVVEMILIKRDLGESVCLQIMSLAFQVDTDVLISSDPDALTRQVEEFIRWAIMPTPENRPTWLKGKE